MQSKKRDAREKLPSTWAALQEFQAKMPSRNQLFSDWFSSKKMDDLEKAANAHRIAVEKVRAALFDDTKTFNSREFCYSLAIGDIQALFSQS